jgi:hypothetical protein
MIWPGMQRMQRLKKLSDRVADVSSRITLLIGYAHHITDMFATEHPLLDTPETRNLFSLTLKNLLSLCHRVRDDVLSQYNTDDPVRVIADTKKLTELSSMYNHLTTPSTSTSGSQRNATDLIPMALLALNAQITEEEGFLRGLMLYHRKSISRALEFVGGRWEFNGVKDLLPETRCCLFFSFEDRIVYDRAVVTVKSRQVLNWRRVFRLLWPQEYRAVQAEQDRVKESKPCVEYFQAWITFDVLSSQKHHEHERMAIGSQRGGSRSSVRKRVAVCKM